MAGKILLVEDDRAIAQSLARLLGREGYFFAHARTAEEAAALYDRDPAFDLVLLDVMLPGEDGFHCCRRLRAQGFVGPVVMLTGRSASHQKVQGLEAGADDYVTKPFDPEELLARLRAHLRRAREYSTLSAAARPTTLLLGPDVTVDLQNRDVLRGGTAIPLTAREFELLSLMARQPDVALDKTWIFQQVWGGASELGMKVLAVYVRRLRAKIEPDMDNPRFLLTVRGLGYKLHVPAPDA